MKEKFLESAKIIIEQNGYCKLLMPKCDNCMLMGNGCMNPGSERVAYFKNYIKENEEIKVEKIQMTEEQAHNFCVDMQFSNVLTVKQMMREKDYIKRTFLQIAEDMYKNKTFEQMYNVESIMTLFKAIEELTGKHITK